MGFDATARRRWLGALALLAALAMLVAGDTALTERLGAVALLIYWLICFGLTGLAILAALLDVRALQRHSREEQRNLFHATLKDIETEARGKGQNRKGNGKPC
jgi:membrane protein implicated in regulation of membrane protease activity